MTVTRLDERTALIVIDLQRAVLAVPTAAPAPPVDTVVANAAALARAFRARSRPVVLVNVAGGAPGRTETNRDGVPSSFPPEATELAPELDAQPDDLLVTKRTWSAFTGTDLDARLRDAGVTAVVLCGVSTSIGVESTARAAHELGYHVVLATDAMTDRSAESHEHSLARIMPRLGQLGTTAELLALLEV